MSDTKFTPGPWISYVDGRGTCERPRSIRYIGVKGFMASICEMRGHGANDEQTTANGYLISAAPDMYEAGDEALAAIYGAIEVCGEIGNLAHARDLLIAALAKARGAA